MIQDQFISLPLQQVTPSPNKSDLNRLAEIGKFSATIVHEVRNPLTTVLMGLKSLKRLEIGEVDQQRLSLALSEAERLQRLLNQILQYSKPQEVNASLIELNSFFLDLLHSQQLVYTTIGTNIQLIPTSMPLYLYGDIDKLKRVFINLINNACEASPEDDKVTCRITSQGDQNTVRIDVHNWGDPIPANIFPQLTQPFFTTKPEGNGLGLAIVQNIIDDHQGNLQIHSTQKEGTTISVTFPMKGSDYSA